MTWEGFALVLGGALLLALFQVINKKLLVQSAPADCISVVNFLGSGLMLFVVAYAFNPPDIKSWWGWTGTWPEGLFWPLIVTSLLNIFILYGSTRAFKYGDVSLIAPIAATQPLIVLLPSWLVLGEVPGFWGYVGLWLMAVGIYIFSFAEEVYVIDPVTGKKSPWVAPRYLLWMKEYVRYAAPLYMLFKNKGVRIAFLVAICGAIAINFDKLSALRSSYMFAPAFILVFCGVVGLIKTMVTSEWNNVKREHITSLIVNPFIFLVVIICFWFAFEFGFAAYVGALKRSTAIFALLLGWLVLHELGVKKRWPGATIMTAGAALLSL
ncbi:MAG: DMT family transporter [Parcubacteria group bacterium]|nr:DMT family transporter [Parcubacteria group bacterium]